MSRCQRLLVALAVAGLCAASAAGEAEDSGAEVEVLQVSTLPESETGGTALIILHGYGSSGRDYRPLAKVFRGTKTRVFLPTAPRPHSSGRGAIWWEFGGDDWPKPYSDDPTANAWPKPSKQLPLARDAIAKLVSQIREKYQPDELAILGHSQGGMLALDVAVAIDPPPDRVAIVASYVLLDSLPNIEKARSIRPNFYISHGRRDRIVSFDSGERMQRLLDANGFEVTFVPHSGGHEIAPREVPALERFLLAR